MEEQEEWERKRYEWRKGRNSWKGSARRGLSGVSGDALSTYGM